MKFHFDKKKAMPHFIASAILLLISIVYFYPALQGYALETHDLKMHKGMSKEIADYRDDVGGEPLWTNSMFGGMAADQISVRYDSNLMAYVYDAITLWFPRPVSTLWMLFIGFYILLMCMKIDPWVALIASIGFGFSSFFFVSLQAGHMSKINAISFMAPLIGGFILLFRGDILKGGILASLFLSLQLWANHPQISYYTFFIIAFVGLYFLAKLAMDGKWSNLGKIVGVAILVVILGVTTSLPSLWGSYEYSKHTIRGKRELTIPTPAELAQAKTDTLHTTKAKDGLDSDYILAWSYGTGETFTFMFPSLKGGGNNDPKLKSVSTLFPSSAEAMNERMASDLVALQVDEIFMQNGLNLATLPSQETGYYGTQRLTNGPVFIGVILCLLSLLALVFSDGKLNWYLFGTTILILIFAWMQLTLFVLLGVLALIVLSIINQRLIWFLFTIALITIMLAWGKNYLEFSELFIQYFPMYNKFRSVTMILVVAELVLPLMGAMFLYEIIKNKEKMKENLLTLYIGSGVLFLFSLIVLANPDTVFDISKDLTPMASQYKTMLGENLASNEQLAKFVPQNEQYFSIYMENLYQLRLSIVRVDAGKAMAFIGLITLLIFLFVNDKIQKPLFLGGIALLLLIEMYPVDQLYLNNEKDEAGDYNYWTEVEKERTPFKLLQGDLALLELEIQEQPWLLDSINKRIQTANANSDMPLSKEDVNSVKMSALNSLTNFRVLNYQGLTSESRTSYYYKSLGGYHGAKFRRIQDLFDFSSKVDFQKVVNMMNVKYQIQYEQDRKGNYIGMKFGPSSEALGNAWFVSDVKFVENADEEMQALYTANGFDPANTAVIDRRFESAIGDANIQRDMNGSIVMTDYKPNKLEYDFSAASDQLVLFSEVFYDLGWTAYIDGEEVEHFRADYLIRGLKVPAGEHQITFKYALKSFTVGSTISLITSLLIILGVLYLGYIQFFTEPKEVDETLDSSIAL